MIQITNTLFLESIKISDQDKLFNLMHQIYPPAYKHLWQNEDCNWYLDHCFSKENLKSELSEIDTIYCFVNYNSNRIGIIRILHNTCIDGLEEKNATFIHRIYLSNETQGIGIAKQLFNWIELQTIKKGNKRLWLKAMDTQNQALKFYEKEGFEIINKTRLDFKLIHENLRGMVTMQKII